MLWLVNTTTNKTLVPLGELADDVYGYGQYLKSNFSRADLTEFGCDESDAGGEMRLQVHDGNWMTHHGDSQYDQDHRGNWGSAFVPYGCTRKQARDIARDLISEASE